MQHSSSSDLPKDSLKIKNDDKFYSRRLSKENSLANPSFRVYYGVAAGAVPFTWESQPGTPKSSATTFHLPPLTPPPSYHVSPKTKIKSTKSNFVNTILPRLKLRRRSTCSSSSPLSLSSPSLSSSSSSFSPMISNRRGRFSSCGTSSSFPYECEDESPTSTICFGVRQSAAGGIRRCRSVLFMKNALLSIVGHGV